MGPKSRKINEGYLLCCRNLWKYWFSFYSEFGAWVGNHCWADHNVCLLYLLLSFAQVFKIVYSCWFWSIAWRQMFLKHKVELHDKKYTPKLDVYNDGFTALRLHTVCLLMRNLGIKYTQIFIRLFFLLPQEYKSDFSKIKKNCTHKKRSFETLSFSWQKKKGGFYFFN